MWRVNASLEPYLEWRNRYWITIERRPGYCNRGTHVAKLSRLDSTAPSISGHDVWPRYYFGLDVAVGQVSEWLARHDDPAPSMTLPIPASLAGGTTIMDLLVGDG